MRVFVDTKFGATLTFELSHINKVSDIKKRIENSHGIPVSTQTLFFNGVELLVDHYHLAAYRIRMNSDLLLEVRDDHVNNQMPQQSSYATQGFVPYMASTSNYDQVPPSHATSASFFNQDQLVISNEGQVLHPYATQGFVPSMASTSNYDQVPPSHATSASFFNQDRLVSNEGQVLHQPDVLKSFSMDEFLERAPLPWTAQETRKMEGFWPVTTGDSVNIQESSGGANRNQDLSPQPPQKLTVIMRRYDKPGGDRFLVEVNANDNVKELRKQLEKYLLDLPAKGYFFSHKERVLHDEKSFSMYRVANGDTIEIFTEPDNIDDFYT